jgi:Undecaprenyl-phosphate galactose phosphotransferase WbaP
MDVIVSASVLAAGFPLWLMIAAAIKLDSRGQVFYGHRRLHGSEDFTAWKFRTMVPNADSVLERYLHENPEMREEWERDHKLKSDPRITRVGSLLRTTSMDEIPQLWNVLKGDMSLIGPRPIVEAEAEKYGKRFGLYERVKPGLTGLWQVSGRNDTTYQERVYLDSYYVRHWSVWLDLYILARTVGVVFSRSGAY